MRIVDNTTTLLGDDLKQELGGASKFRVAAAYFSIFAFDALKSELQKLREFEFIFTAPTFVPNGAIDRIKKERREFFIPKDQSAGALSGSEFEIQLRNKMTQRAVARECADWIRSNGILSLQPVRARHQIAALHPQRRRQDAPPNLRLHASMQRPPSLRRRI